MSYTLSLLILLTLIYTTTRQPCHAGVVINVATVSGTTSVQRPLRILQGESIQLICSPTDDVTSGSGFAVTWSHNGTTLNEATTGRYRRLRLRNNGRWSRLTLLSVTQRDSGQYVCHHQLDTDQLTIIVLTTAASPAHTEVDVSIVDPADSTLPVRHGSSFSLKCVARVRDDPSASAGRRPSVAAVSTGLRWLHDGQPLADGTGDGLCGRVIITDVVDVNTGWLMTLVTCREAGEREAGVYECRDIDGLARDTVTISVARRRDNGRVPVKIVEPASKHTRVRTGSDVTLWCKADVRTTIRWYLNSTQPLDTDVSKGVYVVTGVERNGTGSTSRLHLAPARLQDSGRYSCRNIQDPGDNDTVVLTVTDSQQDELEDAAGTPTMPSTITMRVRSTLSLQCNLQSAGGQYYVEWSKDDVQLSQSHKYVITSDSTASSLSISNTEADDVGQYRCSFWHKDRRKLAGVFLFNVITMPCPMLRAPAHGKVDLCSQPTVYGAVCTFHCDVGYHRRGRSPVLCELDDDGDTYWTPAVPQCLRDNDNVPVSTSKVVLRVGARLQLRCTEPVLSWSKDGLSLVDGFKYNIDSSMLTVRHTVQSDAGLYICSVHRDLTVIGQYRFNVTTLECPRLVLPPGVSVEECPRRPVYGDMCIFRCADDESKQTSSRRVRSCEVKNYDTVYWTGQFPQCSGSAHSTSEQSNSSSSSVRCCWYLTLVVVLTWRRPR